jgi:hypothetical protein
MLIRRKYDFKKKEMIKTRLRMWVSSTKKKKKQEGKIVKEQHKA